MKRRREDEGTHVLYHRACGHLGSVGSLASVEETRALLADMGYFQWRVRPVAMHDLPAILASAMCATCRVDPVRRQLPVIRRRVRSGRPRRR